MSVSGNGSYSQGSSNIRFSQPFQSISPVRSTSFDFFCFVNTFVISKGFDPLCCLRIRSCMVTRSFLYMRAAAKSFPFTTFFIDLRGLFQYFQGGTYRGVSMSGNNRRRRELVGGDINFLNPFPSNAFFVMSSNFLKMLTFPPSSCTFPGG